LADIVGNDMLDAEIEVAVTDIDMFAPFGDPIPWYPKAKQSGGTRVICKPPLALKVRQKLLTRMIVAQQMPDPQIFNWKERGCSRQATRIKTALENGGQHVVVADVRNCFQNVNFDAVYELGLLPPEVIRFASDARYLQLAQTNHTAGQDQQHDEPTYNADNEQVRPAGLLQGFGSSDALWVALIGDLPERLSPFGVPFIYCDNVAVVCVTPELAAKAAEALASYFSDHRAGPLSLTITEHDASIGFEHTGYAFRRFVHTAPDDHFAVVTVEPSIANHVKLLGKLASAVWSTKDRLLDASAVKRMFDLHISPFAAVTFDFYNELLSSFIAEIEALHRNGRM
jgi:hypothetical protein